MNKPLPTFFAMLPAKGGEVNIGGGQGAGRGGAGRRGEARGGAGRREAARGGAGARAAVARTTHTASRTLDTK